MSKIIAGNWKMYGTSQFVYEYISKINTLNTKNEVILFVPSVYIQNIAQSIKNNISIGAQDVSFRKEIASTGEVSAEMFFDLNVKFALIGHSERRSLYDLNNIVNMKLKRSLEAKIHPILCIGEYLETRNSNKHKEFLLNQLESAFSDINISDINNIYIAYEPIWAIGTGLTPSNEEITEAMQIIDNFFINYKFKNYKKLYGGSVNLENHKQILSINNVDGVLIGGASLDVEKFKIISDFQYTK